jgi:hypothetical protein
VHYFVEGSLQADGDRVRITVQLINAASGNHASIVIRCHPGNRPLTIARECTGADRRFICPRQPTGPFLGSCDAM